MEMIEEIKSLNISVPADSSSSEIKSELKK